MGAVASLDTSQGVTNAFPEGLLQQLVHLFGCMEPAVQTHFQIFMFTLECMYMYLIPLECVHNPLSPQTFSLLSQFRRRKTQIFGHTAKG